MGGCTGGQGRCLIASVALFEQKLNNRVAFVREIIREVAGYSPYEKRTMELLKVGKEKRALKVLKNKLGALWPAARQTAIPLCRLASH
jgi:hypothetical protein